MDMLKRWKTLDIQGNFYNESQEIGDQLEDQIKKYRWIEWSKQ